MAQPIQSYMGHAADALQQANLQRGNAGMNSPVPAVMNAMDSGQYTKEGMPPQSEIAMQQSNSTMLQNIGASAGQESVNAERVVDTQVLAASQAKYEQDLAAQRLLQEHQAAYIIGGPSAKLFQEMANPETAQRLKRDAALSMLQANGVDTYPAIPTIG